MLRKLAYIILYALWQLVDAILHHIITIPIIVIIIIHIIIMGVITKETETNESMGKCYCSKLCCR